MKVKVGAEAFFLPGTNNKGVLLLHGYTGTPAEMRPLGDYLHSLGYTVLAVRLPGHGTTPQDLNETCAKMWYEEAERGCKTLLVSCSEVMVAGLSMGGLLAIKIAAELPISKAAFLAAPIFVQDRRAPFLPLLRYFIRYLKKSRKHYGVCEKYNLSYELMPVKPLTGLFELIRLCKTEYLPAITKPCLVLQSRSEHTVNPSSAQYIYDKLGSREKKLVWYAGCGHILTLDCQRNEVFKEIGNFFGEANDA